MRPLAPFRSTTHLVERTICNVIIRMNANDVSRVPNVTPHTKKHASR